MQNVNHKHTNINADAMKTRFIHANVTIFETKNTEIWFNVTITHSSLANTHAAGS